MDHHDHSSLKSSKCIPKDFKKRVEELCELRLKPRAIMQKLEAEGWDHLDHKKYLQVFLRQFRSRSLRFYLTLQPPRRCAASRSASKMRAFPVVVPRLPMC